MTGDRAAWARVSRRQACAVGVSVAGGLLGVASPGERAKAAVPAMAPVDRVVVLKQKRQLLLLRDGKVVRSFRVALGRNPSGTKQKQGDGRTPEGLYVLDARNDQSRFYRSIRVSYPNAADRARAAKLKANPGGDIMIHGLPIDRTRVSAFHYLFNWTDGCIAVTNREMDVLWGAIQVGTPIEIRP